jgi:hypothetical protein
VVALKIQLPSANGGEESVMMTILAPTLILAKRGGVGEWQLDRPRRYHKPFGVFSRGRLVGFLDNQAKSQIHKSSTSEHPISE